MSSTELTGASGSVPSQDPTLVESGAANRTLLALRFALFTTPIPTTPVSQSRDQEETGLTLLELSLRLAHIKRQAEHLHIVDRSHLSRKVSLDIDLDVLSARHIRALSVSEAAERTEQLSDRGPEFDDEQIRVRPTRVWVPVSRHSRQDLAPVVVYDSRRSVVPRMTYQETTEATIAALVKLFRMLVDAHPAVERADDPLYRLRHQQHRARW